MIARKIFLLFLAVFFLGANFSFAQNREEGKTALIDKNSYFSIQLKNGNTFQGKIIKERKDYILLSILEGKGTIKLRNQEIARISRIRRPSSRYSLSTIKPSSSSKIKFKELQPSTKIARFPLGLLREIFKLSSFSSGSLKIFLPLIFIIFTGLVVYFVVIFFAPQRPFLVKFLSFFGFIFFFQLFFLWMMYPFVEMNFFTTEGGIKISKGIFCILIFYSLSGIFLNYLLFHLHNKARILYLGGFLLLGIFHLWKVFLSSGLISQVSSPRVNLKEPIINAVICFLLFFYLKRKKTKEFFLKPLPINKKDTLFIVSIFFILFGIGFVFYKNALVKFTGNKNIFITVKGKETVPPLSEKEKALQGFRLFKGMGYKFFLPPGFKTGLKRKDSLFFFSADRKAFFIISLDEEKLHKFNVMALKAKYNPLLLLLKSISFPFTKGKVHIKNIKFADFKGIMISSKTSQKARYYFYLRNNDNYLNCSFAGEKGSVFYNKKNVLKVIAGLRRDS